VQGGAEAIYQDGILVGDLGRHAEYLRLVGHEEGTPAAARIAADTDHQSGGDIAFRKISAAGVFSVLARLARGLDSPGSAWQQGIYDDSLPDLKVLHRLPPFPDNPQVFVPQGEGEGCEGGGGGAVLEPDEVEVAPADARHLHLDLHPVFIGKGWFWHVHVSEHRGRTIEGREIQRADQLGKDVAGKAILELDGLQGRPPQERKYMARII
jgi:hypothetical protein